MVVGRHLSEYLGHIWVSHRAARPLDVPANCLAWKIRGHLARFLPDGYRCSNLGWSSVPRRYCLVLGRSSFDIEKSQLTLPRSLSFQPAMCFEHIYLDHNANAPMYPDVIEAMRPYFLNAGNTESRHSFGRAARHAWESAKETVARILGADPVEVVFTAGGTEANSLAILGLAHLELLPAHIVSSSIEHPAGSRSYRISRSDWIYCRTCTGQ